MRAFTLCALWTLAATALPVYSPAQQAGTPAAGADPVLTVEFSNPGLSPSHWVLTLHPDGDGHFQSTMGPATADAPGEIRIPDVNRDVQLSPRFAASAFGTAKRHAWFNDACESHIKVAFQGWKTLSYSGPAGQGSCTFNYSQQKDIQNLGDSFLAVSETILAGVRLEMLLQHDPLGLEREMESLAAAAEDGRAQQLCAIKGILDRLAQDDRVMDMVRKRARLLLARADS
jgi:hypothetical protein